MDRTTGYVKFLASRVNRNKVPIRGSKRVPLESRRGQEKGVVKIQRGEDHKCTLVDSETGRVIHSGLDLKLAQKLVKPSTKALTQFRVIDETMGRLERLYEKDRAYRNEYGPDIEITIHGQSIERHIEAIHARLDAQEAKLDVLRRQMEKVWDTELPLSS